MSQIENQNPLVSIGLPVYNCEKFVAQTITSIINQSYTNWELIVTDDGSTDKSMEIIESFQDNRIQIIKDNCNKGISFRLNQQITLAKGDFFCRMDADDIMFPDRISQQLMYLKNHRDISAVSSSAIVIDDNNTIIGIRKSIASERNTSLDIILGKSGHIHPTVFGHTSFFRKYLYNTLFNGIEDFDLWTRAAGNDKIIPMKFPLLFYRDPLTFKYQTYAFRLNQLVKYYCTLRSKKELNWVIYYKLVAKTRIKQIVAKILSILTLDRIFISRRNSTVADAESFQVLLNKAIT